MKKDQPVAGQRPRVSVIVPVRNAERYLTRSLTALREQTLREIEIICVDDCSDDRSAAIVAAFAAEDARFKLLRHTTSLGAGGARNTGIDAASAPFLAFVDADDQPLPHMIETLHKAAQDGDHDITVCGFAQHDDAGNLMHESQPGDRVVRPQAEADIFALTNPPPWNKLIKKTLFTENNVYFPTSIAYEDLATTPRLIYYSNDVKFINNILYRYYINPSSETHSFSEIKTFDYFRSFEVLIEFFDRKGLLDAYRQPLIDCIKSNILYHANNSRKYHENSEGLARYLRRLFLLRDAYVQLLAPQPPLDADMIILLAGAGPVGAGAAHNPAHLLDLIQQLNDAVTEHEKLRREWYVPELEKRASWAQQLEATIAKMNLELEALRKHVAHHQRQTLSCARELAVAKTRAENLQEQLDVQLRVEETRYGPQENQLLAEIERLNGEIGGAHAENERLNVELLARKDEIERLTGETSDRHETIARLLGETRDHQMEIARLTNEAARHAEAASMLERAQQTIARLQNPNTLEAVSSGPLQSSLRTLNMIGYLLFPFGKKRKAKRRLMLWVLWGQE